MPRTCWSVAREISTPPAYLIHSAQDQTVPPSNSDKYAAALKTAGVTHELLKGQFGPHGFPIAEPWTKPCITWLRKFGY